MAKMKSSLSKLRKIALHKSGVKEKREFQPSVKLDELVQAAKVGSSESSFLF